jgi:hypothetical protein
MPGSALTEKPASLHTTTDHKMLPESRLPDQVACGFWELSARSAAFSTQVNFFMNDSGLYR